MGGALEGVCAAGLADAIVDLRETGTSLSQNRLRVLAELGPCEAIFVHHADADPAIADLLLRIEAAQAARSMQYVVLHLDPSRLGSLRELFPGLETPTVIPLEGRDDLVAAHIVVERAALWEHLGELRALGATGIVAVPAEALVV
jgi:ATP phosphoribosyltransferase